MPELPAISDHDLPDLKRDFLESLQLARTRCGDLFRLHLGTNSLIFACHPELADEILQKGKDRYAKLGAVGKRNGLSLVLGNGLLTNSEPESWRQQRRMVQPAFRHNSILKMTERMTAGGLETLERWQGLEDSTLDLTQEMLTLTRDIIYRLVFSQAATAFAHDPLHPIDIPLHLSTARPRTVRGLREGLERLLDTVLEQRQQAQARGETFDDLLETFLTTQNEAGERMSRAQLYDEILTVFSAGHETTAYALTWAFYLLAHHPEVRERLEAELETVLKGALPTAESLSQLPYTNAILKETLRLYPAIPSAPRVALESSSLWGHPIPAGSRIFVSIYTIHHHPQLWEDAETFRPERFLTPPILPHPLTYMPFGAGARSCVGRHLALLEGVLLLALISQRYRLMMPPQGVTKKLAITVYPRETLRVRLERRSAQR